MVGQHQQPPRTQGVQSGDEVGDDPSVPVLKRLHLGGHVAGVPRLVGGLHVDDEQVGTGRQLPESYVALALVVGVVPAGSPGDVTDLHAGKLSDPPYQVHRCYQPGTHPVGLGERRYPRLSPLAPQPDAGGLKVRGGQDLLGGHHHLGEDPAGRSRREHHRVA